MRSPGLTLAQAADSGDKDAVEQMLRNAPPEQDVSNALQVAAARGHTTLLELLLVSNVSVDTQKSDGTTALMLAAAGPHMAVFSKLLAANASVNLQRLDGLSAMIILVADSHIDRNFDDRIIVAEQSFGEYASRRPRLPNPKRVAMLQQLLKRKAETDLQTVDGVSALMIVASAGYTSCAAMPRCRWPLLGEQLTTTHGATPHYFT